MSLFTLAALILSLIPMVTPSGSAVAQNRPSLMYIALGDSYASGHGLSDDPGKGRRGAYGPGDDRNCRRSPSSYPYLVASDLSNTYSVDFRHLACSGATAAQTKLSTADDQYHPDKSLSHQAETANEILNERDRNGALDPVLITITIGANDIGINDFKTIEQIVRPVHFVNIPFLEGVPFPLLSLDSAINFYDWLDARTAPIAPNLGWRIDQLLAHENVHIVLTDYPNPFREGGFGNYCNDVFLSLSCEDAMQQLLFSLNIIMAEQVARIGDLARLRVAPLGPSFAPHYSDCGPFAGPENAPETWFQQDIFATGDLMDDLEANLDQCFHPNAKGHRGIATAVIERARTMLPEPVAAQPESPAPTPDSPICQDAGWPQLSEGLAISPPNPDTATEVHFSFTITNFGCGTFQPEVLSIGGRDPSGEITDPLQIRDFSLAPGESRTITQSTVLTTPGTHEFFPAFLRRGGGWNRIADASGSTASTFITVSEAATTQTDDGGMPQNNSDPGVAQSPATFAGVWIGEMTQVNPDSVWQAVIVINDSGTGSPIGLTSYPSLGCGGNLYLERTTSNSIVLTERLTFGHERCADNGTIELTLRGDGTLDFSWSGIQRSGVVSSATGILTRN